MKSVLKLFQEEFYKLWIDYHYLNNCSPSVSYPYVTGELTLSSYSYEDNSNNGDMLLEIWAKDLRSLIELENKIKNHFRNMTKIVDGNTIHVSFSGSTPRRTNTTKLFKQEVHIDVTFWERN